MSNFAEIADAIAIKYVDILSGSSVDRLADEIERVLTNEVANLREALAVATKTLEVIADMEDSYGEPGSADDIFCDGYNAALANFRDIAEATNAKIAAIAKETAV